MREAFFIHRVTGELLVDRHFPERFRQDPALYLEISEAQHAWAQSIYKAAQARLLTLEGIHRGQTCHIFGNGPSLNDFAGNKDWSGLFTIGVNAAAHRIRPLSYWISVDDLLQTQHRPLYDWIRNWMSSPDRPAGMKTLGRINSRLILQSLERMLKGSADAWMPDFLFTHSPGGPADSIGKGLHWYGSSVHGALDLARYMGFSTVYLWGLDYHDRSHCYTGTADIAGDPKDNPGLPWKDFQNHVEGFSRIHEACKAAGMSVFNANPESRLEVFPKVHPTAAFGEPAPNIDVPEYFCFFSAGTPYEKMATDCVEAFRRHGVTVTPIPFPNHGNWMKNALARAPMLAAIARALPGRKIGLLDADLSPISRPEMLIRPTGCDFACEDRGEKIAKHNRFSAGVLLFFPTPGGRQVLDSWARRCQEDPSPQAVLREQLYLHDAIMETNAARPEPLTHLNFGNRYNRLPEQRQPGDDTVILHTPASRKLLSVIGGKR